MGALILVILDKNLCYQFIKGYFHFSMYRFMKNLPMNDINLFKFKK